MRLRVVGWVMAGALTVTGCAGEQDVVWVTETVTAEADAPPPDVQPLYRRVDDRERFTDGTDTWLFRAPGGQMGCQFVKQIDRTGPLPEFGGGCVNGPLSEPRGPSVMLARDPEQGFATLMEEGGYPGFFHEGGPELQVGDVVDLQSLLCFAPAADSLGCLDQEDGDGFLISGADVTFFDESDHPRIFDNHGTQEIILSRAAFHFDNGGQATCTATREGFTCGDASGLDFPLMEGSQIQSNAVFFDVSGPAPVVTGHNSSNMGVGHSQVVPPGTYFHHGYRLVHDGKRATYTTPQGGTFWVGVDGFGVD